MLEEIRESLKKEASKLPLNARMHGLCENELLMGEDAIVAMRATRHVEDGISLIFTYIDAKKPENKKEILDLIDSYLDFLQLKIELKLSQPE